MLALKCRGPYRQAASCAGAKTANWGAGSAMELVESWYTATASAEMLRDIAAATSINLFFGEEGDCSEKFL